MNKKNDGFTFSGLGTSWFIIVDGGILKEAAKKAVLEYAKNFEERFSRFLPDSEVNSFRNSKAGNYPISKEFAVLLQRADELRNLTEGVYDPAAGGLLERAGYDANYRMKPLPDTEEFVLPKWNIKGETLSLEGPSSFDLGGIGKGYCIDRIADILKSFGYRHFLVDGGGDMFATTKEGDFPWRIAVEYPGKPDLVAGTVDLENQGLAVSDSFRRRWGKWHHLVNPRLRKSIEAVVGAVAVARNAWDADCATSALFFAERGCYPKVSEALKSSYLVFQNDGTVKVSANWKGELF